MDVDVDRGINNIKMYGRNIMRERELDLNIRSGILTKVNSEEFSRL
jgi:hypothetical protein